jgi:hypothetical protein
MESAEPTLMALTITQPWATLIAIGAKRYETRSWKRPYRGPLAIHAAKGLSGLDEIFDRRAKEEDLAELISHEPFASVLAAAGITRADLLPRASIVCLSNLERICKTEDIRDLLEGLDDDRAYQDLEFGNYGDGRAAWRLVDVARCEMPIEAKGGQGLWRVPPDVAEAVLRASGGKVWGDE